MKIVTLTRLNLHKEVQMKQHLIRSKVISKLLEAKECNPY